MWRAGKGSQRSAAREGTCGEASPRNERSGVIGFGQAENPWAIGIVDVSYFHADLRFGKIGPANHAAPGHLVLIGLKIEEEIHGALGELKGGVNAKAAASKSDEAAGESRREALKVSQENGIGFIGGRQAPEILARGQDARDNRDQIFALDGFRDHGFDAEIVGFARFDIGEAGGENDTGLGKVGGFELAKKSDAIHDGHADIGDHGVNGVLLKKVEGIPAVFRC